MSQLWNESDLIEVDVVSGPPGIPNSFTVPRSQIKDGRIKFPRFGGTDHFEVVDSPLARAERQAFRWIMRTELAE